MSENKLFVIVIAIVIAIVITQASGNICIYIDAIKIRLHYVTIFTSCQLGV